MKLVDFATNRRVTITMLVLAVLLFGFVSASRLKLDLLPELSYPTITVRTELPGTAPQEVENLLTRPIEEAVNIIKGVRTVRSVSRAGQSDVTLEFYWGTDMDFAGVDIREKLDMINLPREAERPVLLRFNPANDPIMRLGLALEDSATTSSSAERIARLKQLRLYADEQLAKTLETEDGVAAVKVSGGLEEEIQVLVNQNRLAQLDIPIATVAARLAAENINLSGGRLESGSRRLLVRTINEFQSIDEIANAIIAIRDGHAIRLSDIAEVMRGYKEREAVIRIDGQEAVELAIYKEGDANTVNVAANVKQALTRLQEKLPAGMTLRPVYDQSVFISQAIDEVVSNAIIGGILAALILFFFLRNAWITAVISVSIPVSVVATFNVMYAGGISLNIMSLGGIALAIGMLVDNSIVVLENISRHRAMGKTPLQAARDGTSEVGTAITASTLTTIAVFFPLVFVHGIAGQLFRDQAIVVTAALAFSLFIALTLIPMLAAFGSVDIAISNRHERGEIPHIAPGNVFTRGLHRLASGVRWLLNGLLLSLMRLWLLTYRLLALLLRQSLGRAANFFQRGFAKLEAAYPRVLTVALQRRGLTLSIAALAFVVSLALAPLLGMELIPQFSQGEFITTVRLPAGSQLENTDAVIQETQRAAAALPAVAYTYSVAGTGNRLDANPEEAGENTGTLNVVLQPGQDAAAEAQVMAALRDELATQPGVAATFSRPSLFTFTTPLEIEVAGYDLQDLATASNRIAEAMRQSPAFTDVKTSIQAGHPELQIHFNHARLAQLGLNAGDVANRVADKIRGQVATRYTVRDRKIDVLVRLTGEQRASLADIRNIIINPESARPVPLSEVAEVEQAIGPSEITRISQERVALINANLGASDLAGAADTARRIIATTPLPAGVSAYVAGQNEDMQTSFASMQFALLLAIFLVYIVMAAQFESLIHPLVIMFSIPLAVIGAVLALLLTGTTISVVVFIGLVLLAGIVVNNAIVLIDLVNQLRAKGMERRDALLEAGRSRLRPILMTTLTTVLGLLPMALGFGEGAEIRAPMAITVIGGLSMSTLLTLIVIPVMYELLDFRSRRDPVASAAGVNGLATQTAGED